MPAAEIVRAPGRWPVLGHCLEFIRAPLQFLTSLPSYGELVEIRIGPFTVVVICDLELTRQVLINDRTFDKGGVIIERVREIAGNGIATCPHDLHRTQRRQVQPAFHHQRIPGYGQIMIQQTGSVIDAWKDGGVVDVLAEMQAVAGRTMMATMFGGAYPKADMSAMLEDFTALSECVFQRIWMPSPLDRLPLPINLKSNRAQKRIWAECESIIETRRRSTASDHGDLLSIFLSTGLPDREIPEQVLSFLGAGIESTAAALAWALYLVAQHPDAAERLHAEVDTVLRGTAPTFDDLPRLEYARCIITETLRLYPPVWLSTRITTEKWRLGDYDIPAKTMLAYSPYLIHRLPHLYANPDHFIPDRWSGINMEHGRNTAMIAFGGGARKCIGDIFSLTESILALATITQRWSLEPVSSTPVRPARGLILNPCGLRMRIRSRTSGQVRKSSVTQK